MAFEPPPRTTQLRAIDLTNAGTPYLLKGLDDDDSDWNLVETKPIGTLTPNLGAAGSHLEVVTVTFDDGSVRWFEPHEPVLIGPVTNRIGGDRQQIREVADGHGWDSQLNEHRDVFTRNLFTVEVSYEGDTADTALHFRERRQITAFPFTGPGAKSAAINWLTAAQPGRD
jgi:hypothetical protein